MSFGNKEMKVRLAYDTAERVADCGVTASCLDGVTAAALAFVVCAVSSSFVLFTPTTNVRAAMTALRTERERLGAECDAFERFGERIATLTPTRPGPVGASTAATAGAASLPSGRRTGRR